MRFTAHWPPNSAHERWAPAGALSLVGQTVPVTWTDGVRRLGAVRAATVAPDGGVDVEIEILAVSG